MITRLRQRLTRPVITHDDSGSMILALFAITVLTCLVTVVLMTTISQQAKTRKVTDFTFAGQAVDTAVNDALLTVNKWEAGVLPTSGLGKDGEFRWSWTSTQTPPLPAAPTDITVLATGCRNNLAKTDCTANSNSYRKVKAVLSSFVVESRDNGGGEAAYILTPKRSFTRALFADRELIMQDISRVTAYSSATALPVPGAGKVATNGIADFGPDVRVDRIDMLNSQTYSRSGRCTPDDVTAPGKQCDPKLSPRLINFFGPKLTVTDKVVTDQIAKPPCAPPLTGWVASHAFVAGRLEAGIQCYSSMTFDMDTTVTGTAEVYVTGPIAFVGPVKVNMNNPTMPQASKLQIYSSGTVVALGSGSSVTLVAWALWAPNALCSQSDPEGAVMTYGAMVCQKIFTQGVFIARWDEALATLPGGGGASVWDISTYEERA